MKIIHNNFIPFKGYAAINLFGVIFVRHGANVTPDLLHHEAIHTAQMKDLLYIGFYIWYILEWLIRLCQCRFNPSKAYDAVCFEKEAYEFMKDPDYLSNRYRFTFLKYLYQ